jgi:hypothetical protein
MWLIISPAQLSGEPKAAPVCAGCIHNPNASEAQTDSKVGSMATNSPSDKKSPVALKAADSRRPAEDSMLVQN